MATASKPDEEVILRAENLKRCNICPGMERKYAQFVCNTCHIDLCKQCVGQHLKEENHEVVHFKFKSIPLCKHHEENKCEHYCSQCDIPVCLLCLVSGSHAEHNIRKIAEICSSKRKELLQHIKKIEEDIEPGYIRSLSEIDDLIKRVHMKYTERNKRRQTLEKELKTVVEKVLMIFQLYAEECEMHDIRFLEKIKSTIEEERRQTQSNKEECLQMLDKEESTLLISFKFQPNETKAKNISEYIMTVPDSEPKQITEEQLLCFFGKFCPSLKENTTRQENQSAYSVQKKVKYFQQFTT